MVSSLSRLGRFSALLALALSSQLFLGAQGGNSVLSLPPSATGIETNPVRAELAFDIEGLRPGSNFEAILTLTHEAGWHSYGIDSGSTGLPTTITWTLPPGLEAGAIRWPPPKRFADRGVTSTGYDGRLELRIPMRASKDLVPGSTFQVSARVSWLVCKEACIPGEASFDFSLPVLPAATFDAGRLALMLLFALLGGLVLNLMPCVLPVLSLKVQGLVVQSGRPKREIARNAFAYTLGILLSFWALAALLSLLAAGGRRLGWGFQFQEPGFVAGMAVFLFVFGLNMLGVFEIGAGLSGKAASLDRGEGSLRSLLSGFLATLTATPCSAPFMGTALGFALAADPLSSFLVFSALGLGLAAPVLLLAAFPHLLRGLPKAGRWTESLRQALGFALLATVLWLLSLLGGAGAGKALVPVLAALLLAALASWLLGRWGGFEAPTRRRRLVLALALGLIAFALGSAVYLASKAGGEGRALDSAAGATGGGLPVGSSPAKDAAPAGGPLWEVFSAETLTSLRAENLPVLIDFTADWCLTCKANELAVLDRPRTGELFAKAGLRLLKADWTRADPVITAALEGYGRRSVPLYVLYLPGAAKPLLLPEVLSYSSLEGALAPLLK